MPRAATTSATVTLGTSAAVLSGLVSAPAFGDSSPVRFLGTPVAHHEYGDYGWKSSGHISLKSGANTAYAYSLSADVAAAGAHTIVVPLCPVPNWGTPAYKVMIDGKLAGSGTGPVDESYLSIAFAEAGAHRVVVTTNNAGVKNVYSTTGTVLKRPKCPVLGIIGDSISAGGGIGYISAFAVSAAELLGWDVINFSVPGVGFLNDAGTLGAGSYRLAGIEECTTKPNLWLVALGINDAASTAGQIESAATALLTQLRGPVMVATALDTPGVEIGDAKQAAIVAAASAAGCISVDQRRWLGSDAALYQDNVHPTQAAADILGRFWAEQVHELHTP